MKCKSESQHTDDMASLDSIYKLNIPVAYRLDVSDELLTVTKQKLQLARYPEELVDLAEGDWDQGSKVSVVRRLAAYWLSGYDWRTTEASINRTFNQYKVKVNTDTPYGDHIIHFAHHPSQEESAVPLLFVSGWPGSFLEARKLIEPLTSPTEGKGDQAFHLVVASVPGFGPGDPPTKTCFGPVTTAKAFKALMVDVLGYDRFVTQGGDIGASITRLMACLFPQHVRACHFNFLPVRPPAWYQAPLTTGRFLLRDYLYTEQERENIAHMLQWQAEESAYGAIQRTKPQTLGFGLGDTPIGLLAWFVEKYHSWMDTSNYTMPDDEVLTFVMMHWIQGATPGLRFYKASGQENLEGGPTRATAWKEYIKTPIGFSSFPKELARPPLDWVKAVANLQFYREHDRGGHFPSVECPELLIHDLRQWFGSRTVKAVLNI